MKKLLVLLLLVTIACNQQIKTVISPWTPYDETAELAKNAAQATGKMKFKLIQSKNLDKNYLWRKISPQIRDFSEEDYLRLKPLIFEQDIPTIQSHVRSSALTYEKLTQWYLYRIVKYENDKEKYLNAIIDISADAVSEARKRDKKRSSSDHPIYGMPILLKDNIGVSGMPTTAGAVAMKNNNAPDAFIAARIKEKGGIILGKTNLSEWANYISPNLPNGFSAIGGQTLNPYGRKIFDTGGSSSGSGVAMAANYAAAAVGTETSGSILSPSGKNSVTGLKPTVGLLSRGGIVPITGTYDTPGPMTRNITDNAILLSAMIGEDIADAATKNYQGYKKYLEELKSGTLKGLRFGVIKSLLRDSIYKVAVENIKAAGGIAVEFEPEQVPFEKFSTVLSADMKTDLPDYLNKYASAEIKFRSVAEIVEYNKLDTINRIPYGQGIFAGIVKTEVSTEELRQIKTKLHDSGVLYFDKPMKEYQLDAILSINNGPSSFAASAHYPCLTIPMGFSPRGEPTSLTLIARPFEEDKLLKMGYAFEQATRERRSPKGYDY